MNKKVGRVFKLQRFYLRQRLVMSHWCYERPDEPDIFVEVTVKPLTHSQDLVPYTK